MAQRRLSVELGEDAAAAPVGRVAPAAATDAAISQNSQISSKRRLPGESVLLCVGSFINRYLPNPVSPFSLSWVRRAVHSLLLPTPSALRTEREQHRHRGALANLALDVYAALVLADNGVASV